MSIHQHNPYLAVGVANPHRAQSAMTLRTYVNGARQMYTFVGRLWLSRRFVLVLLLATLIECAPLSSATLRGNPHVYVLYALGGAPTSLGMLDLADRIRNLGGIDVSTYSWDDYNTVISDIAAQAADTPVALIGYSLGANATSWIAHSMPQRPIALLIAYDPSIWLPMSEVGDNVDRSILYHNNGIDPFGHARLTAPRLETIETWLLHVAVDFDQTLHKYTMAAVEKQLLPTGKLPGGVAGNAGRASKKGTAGAAEPAAPRSGAPVQLPEPFGRSAMPTRHGFAPER